MKVKWYKGGNFYEVTQTEYFCPNCGNKSVYVECGEGDYYEGPTHYCFSCKFQFTLPGGSINHDIEIQG